VQTNCGLYKPKPYLPAYSFQQLFLKRLAIGCMVLTAFFAVAGVMRDASTDKSTAYHVAQGFVAERLLRPSSAKFPPRSTYEVTVKYLGRQRYYVAGYLDSLNTFSNWQRSGYTCVIRYIGAGEWTCEKITFE
jgi:hypothetical protein